MDNVAAKAHINKLGAQERPVFTGKRCVCSCGLRTIYGQESNISGEQLIHKQTGSTPQVLLPILPSQSRGNRFFLVSQPPIHLPHTIIGDATAVVKRSHNSNDSPGPLVTMWPLGLHAATVVTSSLHYACLQSQTCSIKTRCGICTQISVS